jgi:hypothetical protein
VAGRGTYIRILKQVQIILDKRFYLLYTKNKKESQMKMFAVYYQKEPTFESMLVGIGDLERKDIETSHQYLGFMQAQDLEDLFMRMQGEVWSPEGEARGLITLLGLRHTSMSVGDVAYDCEEDKWYQCCGMGWELIRS